MKRLLTVVGQIDKDCDCTATIETVQNDFLMSGYWVIFYVS